MADVAFGKAVLGQVRDKVHEGATGFGIVRLYATRKFNQMNLGVRNLLADMNDAG